MVRFVIRANTYYTGLISFFALFPITKVIRYLSQRVTWYMQTVYSENINKNHSKKTNYTAITPLK
jgi:hypothetical protein